MAIKLQAVLAAWKSFDLNAAQQDLDGTAAEITLRQDESDQSRRKLVEQLKELRKNNPEETRKLSALIKNFQNEVDDLCKRSKCAEAAFLKYYQMFLEIFDPVPGLEYAIGLEKKVFLQEEIELNNKQMKQTIKDYKNELKEAKNKDVVIKNLKESIAKYEEQVTSLLANKTKEVKEELAMEYAEKERFLQSRSEENEKLQRKAEERCSLLQQSLEQSNSELFEIKARLDDINEAKSREIEILMSDLERANHQVNVNEQVYELQGKHESNACSGHEEEGQLSKKLESLEHSFEAEISAKDKEISQLISDIKNLEISLRNEREFSKQDLSKLQHDLIDSQELVKKYSSILEQQQNYEDIKKELAILKSMEFGFLKNCGENDDAIDDDSKPLEFLLLEKNKILQNENTSFRFKNEKLIEEINSLIKEQSNLKQLTMGQQSLIAKLETDLVSIQSFSQRQSNDGSSQFELISDAVNSISSSTSVPSLDEGPKSLTEQSNIGIAETVPVTDSLFSIVSAQRERFKVRNEELEIELAAKENTVNSIQNEMDSLRADNLKLYEKIRFLQSFDGNKIKSNPESLQESIYCNQYEQNLDPFASFSQREKRNRYLSLSPFQKIVLSICHLIVNNQTARTATFAYILILHCLIFIVLYKFAFTESLKSDFYTDCSQKFAEHMYKVHGEN